MAKDLTPAAKPGKAADGAPPVKPTKAADAAPAANSAKTVPGIRVVAKVDGFRRAGRAWSKAGTDLPAASIKKADLAALRAESRLTVTDIEMPVAE